MSEGKDDNITPPPRRVTQTLLFDLNSDATSHPTVAAPVADVDGAEDAANSSDGSASPPSDGTVAEMGLPRDNGPLSKIIDDNFLQFASYSICHRAIPTVEDGLKPVQRRVLHSLFEKDDGRFTKVATIVGHTMQYHPHGDASIGDALVNLANKRYLIEGQGNFGNLLTGDAAAAPRYIECRLTELARKEIFNKKTTDFIPSYDGRNQEPALLPSKLPLLLMLGADGIAVGLSTSILPHNFIELLEAEIAIIQKKPFKVLPDFQTGGLMDVSEYDDGIGKIKVRAKIEARGNNVVITELPYGQTTEHLLPTIEDAIRNKKVPVKSIHDHTAGAVEIELIPSAGATPEKVIKSLYAFTACESSITSNIVVLENNRPCERTVSHILKSNTEQLLRLLEKELLIRKGELHDARHEKTLVQIFIEERIYKRIEKCTSAEQIVSEIRKGFLPFKDRLYREITADDIEMLLQIRIRRISQYDMNKNRDEINAILSELAQVEKDLAAIKPYAIRYLKNLIKQYQFIEKDVEIADESGEPVKSRKNSVKTKRVTVEQFPRMTKIMTFGAIEVRALTASEYTIRYDRETGYLGHALRTGDELFKCSSLDKLIMVWPGGRYRVVQPQDKLFVDKNMVYCAIYDRDREYTAIYTDADYGFAYIKRFTFGGVIMGRDYSFLPDKGDVLHFQEGRPELVFLKYKPAKNQRIHQQKFATDDVLVKGVKARGNQLTVKPIQKISLNTQPRWWDDSPTE